MNDSEKAARVAEIADRRVQALRAQAANDIGRRLLAANGSVTAAEVEERLAAEWSPPGERQLADAVAAKLQSAIEVHRREAEAARQVVPGAEAKVAKYEELLASARADLDAAEASDAAEVAEAAEAAATELLAYVRALGADPLRAPTGEVVSANADVATGKAGV